MPKSIIIANWKMNMIPKEEQVLAKEFMRSLKKQGEKDIVICPSFVGLTKVKKVIDSSSIFLGAQDVTWQDEGAYTGGVSVESLLDAGCQYVIVGHSERRQYFGETDEMVNKRIDSSIEGGLVPIVCIGETQKERSDNKTDRVIANQLAAALKGIELVGQEKIIIAYEPVWAIGTGVDVEPSDVSHVLGLINQLLIDMWPKNIVSDNTRLIYGGSIDSDNVENLVDVEFLNGFLVGSASLKSDEFVAIVKKTK